jgi:hypothetical protein
MPLDVAIPLEERRRPEDGADTRSASSLAPKLVQARAGRRRSSAAFGTRIQASVTVSPDIVASNGRVSL